MGTYAQSAPIDPEIKNRIGNNELEYFQEAYVSERCTVFGVGLPTLARGPKSGRRRPTLLGWRQCQRKHVFADAAYRELPRRPSDWMHTQDARVGTGLFRGKSWRLVLIGGFTPVVQGVLRRAC